MLEWNTNCLRVVEASLTPPLLLAPKVLPDVQDPPREDLSKLLDNMTLADVTITVDGQRFVAHCCVLAAQSLYFRGLFELGTGTALSRERLYSGNIFGQRTSWLREHCW